MTQVNTVLRLYDKRCGRFSDHPTHDSVVMERGEVAVCRQPVWHRSFRSLAHNIEKVNFYSSLQAESMKPLPGALLYVVLPLSFLKAYVMRGYVFRGRRGFIYATVYAFARFARLAKYVENRYLREPRP